MESQNKPKKKKADGHGCDDEVYGYETLDTAGFDYVAWSISCVVAHALRIYVWLMKRAFGD